MGGWRRQGVAVRVGGVANHSVARIGGKKENFQEGRWFDEWPTKRCSKVVEQIVLLKPILAYGRTRRRTNKRN